ncbi:MAG: NAD-dependent epimerase/dehydratase family protein, partial [Chloroflexi bacterium]|nr:NAD-dependent epimerase/dehydratase family protein [Chloroflexota bacterium]
MPQAPCGSAGRSGPRTRPRRRAPRSDRHRCRRRSAHRRGAGARARRRRPDRTRLPRACGERAPAAPPGSRRDRPARPTSGVQPTQPAPPGRPATQGLPPWIAHLEHRSHLAPPLDLGLRCARGEWVLAPGPPQSSGDRPVSGPSGPGADEVLLLGGAGLVGSHLRAALDGRTATVTSRRGDLPGTRPLDITDGAALTALVRERRPRIVVLAAASIHVEGCELDPDGTRRANVGAAEVAAAAAREVGAALVVFSSEYVFAGGKGRYAEADAVGPLSEY